MIIYKQHGKLAKQYCGLTLELRVLKSGAGWYLGTINEEGPVSRESLEYWSIEAGAQAALITGNWNQRETP